MSAAFDSAAPAAPVPPFLAALPRWVLWREVVLDNGRRTKPPSRVIGSGQASHSNPAHWAPYALTERVHRNAPAGRWSGIGIVLGRLDDAPEHLAGLDLDQCLDAGGTPVAWAQPFLDLVRSYSETSPSGLGIKVFFRIQHTDLPAFRRVLELADHEHGRKRTFNAAPAPGEHAPAAEVYTSHRFFTVTGNRFADTPESVALLGAEQLFALATLMGPRPSGAVPRKGVGAAPDAEPWPAAEPVDDAVLAAKLDAALRRSPKLAARWNGDTSGLSDATRSGFDMSLGGMLKARGFTYSEMRAVLRRCPHSAAADQSDRYAERIWARSAAAPPDAARPASHAASDGGCAPLQTGAPPVTDFHADARAYDGQAQSREDPADDDAEKPKSTRPVNGSVPPAPGRDDLTQDGVAWNFAAKAGGRLAFDHTSQEWFAWEGGRWTKDAKASTFNLVRLFCYALRDAAAKPPNDMAKIAFIASVERAARTDPRIATSHEDWDRDRWLLGVPGGVVDLRTGELRPGDPRLFIRRQAAVAPAPPGTPAPLWFAFLKEATRGDADLQGFLQRLAGYVLTGDVTEEMLTFLYGPGGNGKGVFLGALMAILADYAVSVPIEVFVANSRLNLEYYRARMAGARLVTASETEAGATWSESLIKELTGNEAPLSARDPYGKPFTFLPHFKLCLVGNHAPRLKGRTPAMERRLRVVPFTHEPEKRDPELKERLRAEYPAILRWMLEGCIAWREKRLGTATAIERATSSYFAQQDGFRRWLSECCDLGADPSERPGKLFADFTAWSRDNGEPPISSGEFREMVERTQGLRYVTNKGTRYVRGIALKPQHKRNPPPPEDGNAGEDEDETCSG